MATALIPRSGRCFACSRYRFCGFGCVVRHLSSEPTQTSRNETRWQVSSHGRCCDTRGRISWGYLRADGYVRVKILGNLFYVHRLVAHAFLGPPPGKHAWQVHHRDGDTSNNNVQNLEYVTPSQNTRYAFADPSRIRSSPLRFKPVMFRQVGGQSWTTCPSAAMAAQQLQVSEYIVSRCCCGNSAARGFEFRFPELSEASLQGEEWRPMLDPDSGAEIPGRMVSSLGRIQSTRGVVHRGHLSKGGYYKTSILVNAVAKGALVHRLVALAFMGHPSSRMHTQINHKDGDKSNNAVGNLEYVTPSENAVHRFRMAQSNCEGTDGTIPCAKQVWSREFGSTHEWMWHPSMAKAAHALGLHVGNISACSRGLQRQTRGFEFQLAEAEDVPPLLPGEEWRKVDLPLLLKEKWLRLS